jgi:hypothetical protein
MIVFASRDSCSSFSDQAVVAAFARTIKVGRLDAGGVLGTTEQFTLFSRITLSSFNLFDYRIINRSLEGGFVDVLAFVGASTHLALDAGADSQCVANRVHVLSYRFLNFLAGGDGERKQASKSCRWAIRVWVNEEFEEFHWFIFR